MSQKIIPFYHQVLEELLTKNDSVVDATCGNGFDTAFLAQIVKHVYSFDIQQAAIDNTKARINSLGFSNVTYHQDGHENLDLYVNESIKAAVYNLGYLPNSDKTITTKESTTILSIQKVMNILEIGGLIIVAIYVGHPNGKIEGAAVESFAKSLDSKKYQVLKYQHINHIDSPYLIIIEKTH